MVEKDYMKYELKRLSKINDELEKRIEAGFKNNEHELILENVKNMCEIMKVLILKKFMEKE